ncbi:MAG: plasmid replication protein RepC [Pseudotabrizicola sp.]|uniref:plasmid replication protein RepC n=1 Tax=Pseudotabrizicola sp. TaxID=2939647 RepID=UPI00271A6386|nr:plasmid replication protein RepC [Pseudotabrizicola sp.]MDO9638240.1 plasmid replication protein RepC [Pseudotabrizicola sp.]
MSFKHASAPVSAQTNEALSADNAKPDRFTLIDTVRRAAAELRIGPPVIATLDALLSCLPPKRPHDIVFASNATLVMRRNGISDRTLRRHLAQLVEAGFLTRIDSPNGKRYSRRDPAMGTVLRFGLDLAPLFAAFARLRTIAQEQAVAIARNAYLRTKLRVAIHLSLANDCDCDVATAAQKALRRKLTNDDLNSWLEKLPLTAKINEEYEGKTAEETIDMSGSSGQNVRHQQNSTKDLNDKEDLTTERKTTKSVVTLDALTLACPQATGFLLEKLRSPLDIVSHARRLAPMIGIDQRCYDAAEAKHGPLGAALTIWGLLEMQDKIQRLGGYFRAITSGARSGTFDPWNLIDRLIAKSQNCPRTTAAQLG